MNSYISEKKAGFLIKAIGTFYIISGIWEILHIMQGESIVDSWINLYHYYVYILGLITILTGIGLCFRLRIFRIFALILAWWNLFTAPTIDILWYVYTTLIKKVFVSAPLILVILYTIFLIILLTLIRIYIIYTLRVSRAGYLFLKSKHKQA